MLSLSDGITKGWSLNPAENNSISSAKPVIFLYYNQLISSVLKLDAMIITRQEFLLLQKSRHSRIIGLDVGEKTIGIALSDAGLIIASPLRTIKRQKFHLDYMELQKTIDEFKIYAVVIGFPLNMNGSEGPRCQSVQQFAKNIIQKKDIPIIFWDERLSTMAVNRQMIDADISRQKRDKLVDKLAASYILQGFLDSFSSTLIATSPSI